MPSSHASFWRLLSNRSENRRWKQSKSIHCPRFVHANPQKPANPNEIVQEKRTPEQIEKKSCRLITKSLPPYNSKIEFKSKSKSWWMCNRKKTNYSGPKETPIPKHLTGYPTQFICPRFERQRKNLDSLMQRRWKIMKVVRSRQHRRCNAARDRVGVSFYVYYWLDIALWT